MPRGHRRVHVSFEVILGDYGPLLLLLQGVISKFRKKKEMRERLSLSLSLSLSQRETEKEAKERGKEAYKEQRGARSTCMSCADGRAKRRAKQAPRTHKKGG